MEGYASDLVPKVSDKWHADETVENVNGKNRMAMEPNGQRIQIPNRLSSHKR